MKIAVGLALVVGLGAAASDRLTDAQYNATRTECVEVWSSANCRQCQKDRRWYARLQRAYTVRFYDIDRNRRLAAERDIEAVPTYIMLIDDEEVCRSHDIHDFL